MKNSLLIIITCLLIGCYQTHPPKIQESNKISVGWIGQWFDAWELVSDNIFHLPHEAAPEFLFFDETNVYTTSVISAPNGTTFTGPKLFNEKLKWRTAKHNDTLVFPDGQRVPIGLMTFAAHGEKGKAFFAMAAPSFWKKSGIDSKELGLDKLLTGVFLHEFAHSRQFNGAGAVIDSIEKTHEFKEVPLTDDIVQGYFKKDTVYVKAFREEAAKFYEAAFAANEDDRKRLTREAIALLKARQEKYFINEKMILKKLDNIFLSMEGLGQFVAVAWLIHAKGGKVPYDVAVEGFRRTRSQWSQEEGLAMFLLLNKLTKPNWNEDIFVSRSNTITDLLEKYSK